MSNKINKKAVIIGSGVAGIATAIRLTVEGFSVSVYEKNSYPGGKLSAFEKDGFHFDAGPSLFTQPQNIEELFELANEPIEKYFPYSKLDIACKYFYENGKTVNAYSDANLFAKELLEKVNEPEANVKKYLQRSEKLYNNIANIFLNYSLHKKRTWFHPRIIKSLSSLKFSYLFKSLGAYNKRFAAKETQQIFNRFATYNGSNPYKAPAMLSLIPHLEQTEGAYFPKGGMINITNALYNLALQKGVEFHFDAAVEKIICPDNKAAGIVVNKKNIFADVIVSNSDVYFTYKNLLGNDKKANKVLKQERSSSALVFYWGINKNFPKLELHNILFTDDYRAEFDNIFKQKKLYADPTIYINITSKQEAAQAPTNCENWFVMINVPADTNYDVERLRTTAKNIIIAKLNRILNTNIEEHIVTEDMLHPQSIETTTGSYLGSLYGTSSNSKKSAFMRHPNFTSHIKNLYCCGGSVHPGGGIPLCLKSAKIVADLIKRDTKKQRKVHA
jgi:phytoene desaturase